MREEPMLPDGVMALARAQLSFRTKAGHLSLLIVTMAASAALVSLLLTERGLPGRTYWALAALLVLNLVWAGYAGWVLSARRTLLANHRVIAARIGLGASSLFTLGSAALGLTTEIAAAYLAAAIGLVLTGLAAAMLTRARRRHSALEARRAQLLAAMPDGR